jgi:hypothetical protein
LRPPAGTAAALLLAIAFSACILDFDPYDPRVGATEGAGTSSSAASAASGAGGGATSGSSSASGGSAGSPPCEATGTVVYIATVAECVHVVDLAAPCPTNPATEYYFSVDAEEGPNPTGGTDARGFLRFDLAPGCEPLSLELDLLVAFQENSDSDMTGAVYASQPFDLASLATTAPMPVGDVIGADQGDVVEGDHVIWDLPVSAVNADGNLYLVMVTTSTNGVDYGNAENLSWPATLTVTYP